MEDDIEEGAVQVDATVVFEEAQLSERIHEATHPRPHGAPYRDR